MAEMKKNGSEDEYSVDEPDEEVGSDSDGSWNEDDESKSPAKRGKGRAVARGRGGGGGAKGRGRGRGRGTTESAGSKRPGKGGAGNKAKRSKTEDDDDDDDVENEDDNEKDEEDLDEEEVEDEEDEEEEEESESSGGEDDSKDPSKKEFKSGKFVVLKKDLTTGDMPPIWKIDGKVLLQKFMPFDKEGKTLYKSTSTYSGWSHHNRDQYRPAPVKLEDEGPNETIVEFLRDSMEPESAGDAPATATSTEAVA